MSTTIGSFEIPQITPDYLNRLTAELTKLSDVVNSLNAMGQKVNVSIEPIDISAMYDAPSSKLARKSCHCGKAAFRLKTKEEVMLQAEIHPEDLRENRLAVKVVRVDGEVIDDALVIRPHSGLVGRIKKDRDGDPLIMDGCIITEWVHGAVTVEWEDQ